MKLTKLQRTCLSYLYSQKSSLLRLWAHGQRACLLRLRERGLVKRTSAVHGRNRFEITDAGRKALEERR